MFPADDWRVTGQEGRDSAMDRSSALDAAGCTCWQRAARWVYRLVPGQVMLAAPGGEERAIQGLAVVVWVVLDLPGTSGQIADRIAELWPDRVIDEAAVDDALEVLQAHGVVEPIGASLV